jgi:hypothetical protein
LADAVLTLPEPRTASTALGRATSLADNSDLEVKWDGVHVVSVSSLPVDAVYSGGDRIALQVQFSAAVDVETTGGLNRPYLKLEVDK